MTFYEAALRVLEEAGAPLHLAELTKRTLDKGLLSHVGKQPEVTMLSRLAAMAKRPRDRKVMVTAKDTFALTDWMLPEDAEALATTGIIEPNPEEKQPPLRPVERHPEPRAEYLRAIGRQAERSKRRDEDGRKRRYPPIAEVAFEVLSDGNVSIVPTELLARMRARELASDELSVGQLIDAMAEDNQRRIDQGRKPQFAALKTEAGEVQVCVEPQSEGGPAPVDVQAAFCAAMGLRFENGRVELRHQPQRAEQERAEPPSGDELAVLQTAKVAVKDARRTMARVLRRRVGELEAGTFEKACVKLLHAHHFRELKVAKRAKDGPLLTARRRDGSLELRFAVRIVKGNGPVERRHVQELRRDLGHYGANIGLLISTGEARGDARSDATQGALVMLWCGDGLADKFLEGQVGVAVTNVELYELDEDFFAKAKADADESSRRREERHKDRDRSEPENGSSPPPSAPQAESAPEQQAAPAAAQAQGEGDEEGDDEGDDEAEGAEAGAPNTPEGAIGQDGKRRRRRRRRRRGGAGREGVPGSAPAADGTVAPADGTQPTVAEAAASTAASTAPTPPMPAESNNEPAPSPTPPPPAPTSNEGQGQS